MKEPKSEQQRLRDNQSLFVQDIQMTRSVQKVLLKDNSQRFIQMQEQIDALRGTLMTFRQSQSTSANPLRDNTIEGEKGTGST